MIHQTGGNTEEDNSRGAAPVGSLPASGYALPDVAGNVWGWCADWYKFAYYRQSPRQDPLGPPKGSDRVLRGGCWLDHGPLCRSAYRSGYIPTFRNYHGCC